MFFRKEMGNRPADKDTQTSMIAIQGKFKQEKRKKRK